MKKSILYIFLGSIFLYSCEKEEIILNDDEKTPILSEFYLSGIEMIEESYFVQVKSNQNNQPTDLYTSSSLEIDTINSENRISESEYASDGKLKSYKQQISDLVDPVFYTYKENKVDLTFLEVGSYQSVDLPYVGSGVTSIYDLNQPNPFLVNSLGTDTLFYEFENGNIKAIRDVNHVLYEYTYDNQPYFGKGILYDFFSSELGFQWWFIPEFVPTNNILSIKKYVYADDGIWTPNEDAVYVYNFTYTYNENGYPTEMHIENELWMKFYYQIK
jgi:hypothetical protein